MMIMASVVILFTPTNKYYVGLACIYYTLLPFINSDCAFLRIELVKKIIYPINFMHVFQSLIGLHLKDLDQYVMSNNKENGWTLIC
jgi:hypothetical protein